MGKGLAIDHRHDLKVQIEAPDVHIGGPHNTEHRVTNKGLGMNKKKIRGGGAFL